MEKKETNNFVIFNKIEKQFQIGAIQSLETNMIVKINDNWLEKKDAVIVRKGKELNANEIRCNRFLRFSAMQKLNFNDVNDALEQYNFKFEVKEEKEITKTKNYENISTK